MATSKCSESGTITVLLPAPALLEDKMRQAKKRRVKERPQSESTRAELARKRHGIDYGQHCAA